MNGVQRNLCHSQKSYIGTRAVSTVLIVSLLSSLCPNDANAQRGRGKRIEPRVYRLENVNRWPPKIGVAVEPPIFRPRVSLDPPDTLFGNFEPSQYPSSTALEAARRLVFARTQNIEGRAQSRRLELAFTEAFRSAAVRDVLRNDAVARGANPHSPELDAFVTLQAEAAAAVLIPAFRAMTEEELRVYAALGQDPDASTPVVRRLIAEISALSVKKDNDPKWSFNFKTFELTLLKPIKLGNTEFLGSINVLKVAGAVLAFIFCAASGCSAEAISGFLIEHYPAIEIINDAYRLSFPP